MSLIVSGDAFHMSFYEDFAKEIGVSTRTLFMYESGQPYPKSVEVYKKIADVMKVDYSYLLEDTDHFLAQVQNRYGNQEMNKLKKLDVTLINVKRPQGDFLKSYEPDPEDRSGC